MFARMLLAGAAAAWLAVAGWAALAPGDGWRPGPGPEPVRWRWFEPSTPVTDGPTSTSWTDPPVGK